jgi:hypothetical protein
MHSTQTCLLIALCFPLCDRRIEWPNSKSRFGVAELPLVHDAIIKECICASDWQSNVSHAHLPISLSNWQVYDFVMRTAQFISLAALHGDSQLHGVRNISEFTPPEVIHAINPSGSLVSASKS